jgi:hypothetical protein
MRNRAEAFFIRAALAIGVWIIEGKHRPGGGLTCSQ